MTAHTVHVRARPDTTPSRWLWLVKWLLLIPHYIVLAILGIAFVALTLVAYVAIVITGRYPESIFHFNIGVLRWAWRVGYYGYEVLGTDRYPPFTLAEVPDYPAGLSIDGPPRPPRWLPLVAWLFAIPHLLIVGALNGAVIWETNTTTVPLSVVTAGVLVLAVALLFTGRRIAGLYDLLMGAARWTLRTIAYVALLTDRYPPFRLDQGPYDPDDHGPAGTSAGYASPYAAPVTTGAAAIPPAEGTAVTEGTIPAGSAATHPAPPTPPRSDGSVAGRVIALVAGVLLLLPAIGIGIGGVALLTFNNERDATGAITSPVQAVSSPTAAITVEELQAADAWVRTVTGIGDVRITATGNGGDRLFLGVAPQSAVDAWLAGTAHDELVQVYSNGTPRYQRATGVIQPVADPNAQGFWAARTAGVDEITLDWPAADGRYSVVLANADGSPGVAATARVATRVPDLAPLGWGLIGAGTVLAIVAFVLIYLGAAGLGRRHSGPVPPAGGWSAPPGGLPSQRRESSAPADRPSGVG